MIFHTIQYSTVYYILKVEHIQAEGTSMFFVMESQRDSLKLFMFNYYNVIMFIL